MNQEMKILMIGNKDSGKTTYMASAYGLMKSGKFGFMVRADSDTDELLSKLYHDIENGRYPVPTDKREHYTFDLYYYQQSILSFEWIDYYGGVITDAKSQQLQSDMDEANAIMLFVEADALLHNQTKVTQIRRILYLISEKLMKEEKYFDVIIVLTKYDKVSDTSSFARVSEPLKEFSERIKGKAKVYYRIIPVSCTASGFINVDLPLIDILHSGLIMKSAFYAFVAKEKHDEAVKYENRRGLLDWTFSKILGVPTNGEIADKAEKEMHEQMELLRKIKTPLEKLSQYREDYNLVIPRENQEGFQRNPRRKKPRFSGL